MTRYRRRLILAGLAALPVGALAGCGGDDDDDTSPTGTGAKQPEGTRSPGGASAATTRTADARATPSPRTPSPSASSYYPPATGEWERADLKATGWSPMGVEKLIAVVKESKSATFMVVTGGRIVTENYFPGSSFPNVSAGTVADVASVQKSVASTLLGMAQEKGLLKIDEAVSKYLGPGWSKAPPADEAKITIRHLMTHASGLHARTLQKVDEPGTKFDYNTPAYQKTRPVLEKAAGMDINTLSRAWLFDAIGVSAAAKWAPRPSGEKDATGAAQWGLNLSARDMARFGLVSLRTGRWGTSSIVDAAWYREAWAPSKVARDYGLLWWLMGNKPRFSKAPDDWVAALGAQDQKIYVFPGLDTVVTRQGLAAKESSEHESDFDQVLFQALAAARA